MSRLRKPQCCRINECKGRLSQRYGLLKQPLQPGGDFGESVALLLVDVYLHRFSRNHTLDSGNLWSGSTYICLMYSLVHFVRYPKLAFSRTSIIQSYIVTYKNPFGHTMNAIFVMTLMYITWRCLRELGYR